MNRIMIGIPVNRSLSPKFSISLAKITNYLIMNNWTVDINYDNGSVLSSQRNKIIQAALKEEMHLLFIDTDMIFEIEALEAVLKASDAGDIIGGLCFMRRMPFKPVVFSEDLVESEGVFRGMPISDFSDYPFECAAVGCAFLLIKYESIERILADYNWPFNHYPIPSGDVLGEDLSFMHRCNLLKLKIICVPGVEIGHITERVVTRKDHIAAMEFIKSNES